MTDLNQFYKQLFALFNNFSNDCMLDGRFKASEINRCLEITHLATQLIESLNQLEKQYESNDIPSILALTLFQYQFQNQSLDKNHLIKALRVLSHYSVLAEPLEKDVNTAPSQNDLKLMTQALNKFLELNFKKGKKHPISEEDFIYLLVTEIYPDLSNNEGKFNEKISLFENFNFNQFNLLTVNENGKDNTLQFNIINQSISDFNQEYHDLIKVLHFRKERIEIFGKIDINSTFINHDLLRIDRLINQLNIDSVNSLNYMQAKVQFEQVVQEQKLLLSKYPSEIFNQASSPPKKSLMNKIKSFLKRNPSRLSQLLKDSQNLELNTSGIQRAVEIQNQLNLLTQNNESSRLRFIQRIKLKKMARIQKNLNGYFNECELNIRLINPLEKALTTRSIKCRQMNKLIDTLFNGMNEINDQLFSKSHSSENVYQILHRADFHYLPSNRLISALIQLLNSPPPLLSPAEGQKWLTVLKENKDKPNLDMTQLIKECEIDNEVKASLIRLCLMMQHLKDIKLVGNVTVEDKFAFPLNYTLNLVEADQQTSNQAQETIDHLKEITRTIMASQFHIPPQSMVSMPLNGAYQSEINHLVPIMTSQIARSSHLNPSTSHLDNNKNSSLHRLN